MRSELAVAALIACVVLWVCTPARASEMFVCADNTTVHITAENRAEMNNHPCVREWFAASREKALAKLAANPPDNPWRVTVAPWRGHTTFRSTLYGYDHLGSLTLFTLTGHPVRPRGYCGGFYYSYYFHYLQLSRRFSPT